MTGTTAGSVRAWPMGTGGCGCGHAVGTAHIPVPGWRRAPSFGGMTPAAAPMIRPFAPADIDACLVLLREAFWNLYRPGATEQVIWHRLVSGHPDLLEPLALVATFDERVVGCIASTRARIVGQDGAETPVAVLGPIAVDPELQRRGIGAALLRASIDAARAAGERGIFLYGSPDYYPRFGFEDARRWGVTTADGGSFDAFMGLELTSGALADAAGRLRESGVYEVSDEEVDAFEATRPGLFPVRERLVLPGQL